jgi:glycosyltransferase involved in cell wall biosynthesis
LLRAIAGELYRVATTHDIDAIVTYYVDPHAAVANRVADALALVGKHPIVVHSLEGSDLLDSICEHFDDGSAAILIADTIRADIVCAVSAYTANRFLAAAEEVGGQCLLDKVAGAVEVRYPGLPPAASVKPPEHSVREFRKSIGISDDDVLISTIGRLEEEKGLDMIVALAKLAEQRSPGIRFVIAGTGSLAEQLVKSAAPMPNLTVLCGIDSAGAHLLRAASVAGVFPTRVIRGFVETFCVSALEYQALGVPVLASAIGGIPEATPGDLSLIMPGAGPEEWWHRIELVRNAWQTHSRIAFDFASNFTSAKSAERIVELIARASMRKEILAA